MPTYEYFDEIILGKKLILFGAGQFAIDTINSHLHRYEIAYICDNDKKKWNTEMTGIPVCSPSKLLEEDNRNVIVLITTMFRNEITIWLVKHGIPYIDINIFERPCEGNIVYDAKQYLFERCSNRKLLIFGTGIEAQKMSRLCSMYNMNVEYFLENESADTVFEDKNVKAYFDLVYEEPDGFFIIVANEKESYGISRQKFLQLGLIEDIDFSYYKSVPFLEETLCYDVTLSSNRIRDKIEGFELFGDLYNSEALKIVALGGSTTESTLSYIKGWPQYLTNLCYENGYSVIMYCGGIAAHSSSQELLKLIRDVLPLKPDVVLSYNGFTDLWSYPQNFPYQPEREKRPFITEFQVQYMNKILQNYPKEKRNVCYGLQNDKTASEFWLDNMKIMHAIAKEFNILFLSFLQPFYYIGGYKPTDSQKIIFDRSGWDGSILPLIHSKEHLDSMISESLKMMKNIKNIDYITDLTHIFSGHANIYRDVVHVTERGNEIIAENIYRVLVKHLQEKNSDLYEKPTKKEVQESVNIFDGTLEMQMRKKNVPEIQDDDGLSDEQNAEFRKYLEYLKNERYDARGNIGAIVMNCNPFTNGHRYLVERASSGMDFLYVFVVEEDKSFFPFADRFKLVSEGLADLKNVRVLRSGKFIISTITFPSYFSKDSVKEVAVDTSLDLRLFGKYIAPALGIGTRFAGSEPTDMVTSQYNKAMRETLLQYGVKFVEFERITANDTVISASNVRALLEKRDLDGIRNLVPDVTYKYLLKLSPMEVR